MSRTANGNRMPRPVTSRRRRPAPREMAIRRLSPIWRATTPSPGSGGGYGRVSGPRSMSRTVTRHSPFCCVTKAVFADKRTTTSKESTPFGRLHSHGERYDSKSCPSFTMADLEHDTPGAKARTGGWKSHAIVRSSRTCEFPRISGQARCSSSARARPPGEASATISTVSPLKKGLADGSSSFALPNRPTTPVRRQNAASKRLADSVL